MEIGLDRPDGPADWSNHFPDNYVRIWIEMSADFLRDYDRIAE
jgi:hypothetical protein